MIQVLIALLVIVVVARLILKGYRAEPVLFIAGLVLMICTALTGWGSVLPKGVASTGISFLDPFEVMRDLFSTRAADLGLMIMALMGFAHYMDHIGANEAVVRVVTKPLRALRSPYVLLFFSYLLASLLQLAIPQPLGLLPPRLVWHIPRRPSMLSGDLKRSIWMWWNTLFTTRDPQRWQPCWSSASAISSGSGIATVKRGRFHEKSVALR